MEIIIKKLEKLRESADRQNFVFAGDTLSIAINEIKNNYKEAIK